jgi:hypothetical protein
MRALAAAALALTLGAGADAGLAWPQWGGPNRNFVTGAADLAASWPAAGPRRIWARPLGDGFSSIVTDGATLYTLHRDGADDVAVALDAKTGSTPRWGEARRSKTCSGSWDAPRAAPLVSGDRLSRSAPAG